MAWGPAWVDSAFVFTREDGEPLHPETVTNRFERALRGSGLRTIRLHDLRHTSATIALAAGVHPKIVQERLGRHLDHARPLQPRHAPMGAEAAAKIGCLLYAVS